MFLEFAKNFLRLAKEKRDMAENPSRLSVVTIEDFFKEQSNDDLFNLYLEMVSSLPKFEMTDSISDALKTLKYYSASEFFVKLGNYLVSVGKLPVMALTAWLKEVVTTLMNYEIPIDHMLFLNESRIVFMFYNHGILFTKEGEYGVRIEFLAENRKCKKCFDANEAYTYLLSQIIS